MIYRCITLPLITSQPEMQWLRKRSMASTPQQWKTMTRRSVRKAKQNDQGSEATTNETVKAPTPRRKTRSQGKKAFNIPAAASPSDSEDEPTPPKRCIGRIKAHPKYLRSLPELGKLQLFPPFWEKWEIPLSPPPTFPTFPTIHFPTFGAAIIKSITFPARLFLMETCPFKERTQPWSQPWLERDLPSKKF